MKTEAKESIKKILVICFASFLMALNIKSFVRTGGLYPGGATGLALLIQRAADMFLHITIPYTIVNILLNAIPVYIGFRFIGKKFTMYSCLMIVLTSVLTDIGLCNHIRYAADQYFWRTDQWICHRTLPAYECDNRRNGFYCNLSFRKKRDRFVECGIRHQCGHFSGCRRIVWMG